MSTKKISMLLAAVMGMGMILCGIASAGDNTDEEIYFELRARGTGLEYIRDNATLEDTPFIVEQYKLPRGITFYIEIDRTEDEDNIRKVVQNTEGSVMVWEESYENGGCAKLTEDGYITRLGHVFYNGVDDGDDGNNYDGIKMKAPLQIKLKQIRGRLFGNINAVPGVFWSCNNPDKSEGTDDSHIKRDGSLQLMGKYIAWDDLPEAVQDIYDPAP